VTSCGDSNEALAAPEIRNYDLLLADIVMPEIDGIELAQRATEHLPTMKVLFITGFAAVALNAQKSGASRNAKILSKRLTCATWSPKSTRSWPPEKPLRRLAPNCRGGVLQTSFLDDMTSIVGA